MAEDDAPVVRMDAEPQIITGEQFLSSLQDKAPQQESLVISDSTEQLIQDISVSRSLSSDEDLCTSVTRNHLPYLLRHGSRHSSTIQPRVQLQDWIRSYDQLRSRSGLQLILLCANTPRRSWVHSLSDKPLQQEALVSSANVSRFCSSWELPSKFVAFLFDIA
jgi:hypothetical protein